MDRVTFEIAPLNERIRGAAVVGAALVLTLVALTKATWYTAHLDGESLALRLLEVPDAPALRVNPSSGLHWAALFVLFIASLGVIVRLAYMIVTLLYGSPLVKRGLFSSKLRVAWLTSARAHIWMGIVMVLAVYTALDTPTLRVDDTFVDLPATITRSWGGGLLVLGGLVAHLGFYLIARHPLLAQSQGWELPASMQPTPSPAPVRASRPMIKSPLPPPPSVDADPFRSPPRTKSLEDKLVRPALPTQSPAVVASDNVEEPSLLR